MKSVLTGFRSLVANSSHQHIPFRQRKHLPAVSKIRKYATSSSGDTVEVVERPNGGLSVVMADGQSSGRGAKWISTMVVRRVISLLADGFTQKERFAGNEPLLLYGQSWFRYQTWIIRKTIEMVKTSPLFFFNP